MSTRCKNTQRQDSPSRIENACAYHPVGCTDLYRGYKLLSNGLLPRVMHAMPCQSWPVALGQANTDSPVQQFPDEYHRSWVRICRHLEKQAGENGTRCDHNGCPSRNSLLTSRIHRSVGRQKQQRRILSRRQGNIGRIIVITSRFGDIRHGQYTPLNVCSAQSRSPGELSRTSNVTILVARLVARIAGACRCSTSVEIAFDVGDARSALLACLIHRDGAVLRQSRTMWTCMCREIRPSWGPRQ